MLLWVDNCCGAHDAASAAEFSRHCQVRPTDQQHLWAALSLASNADVICFEFEHPDMSCLKFMADTKARFPSVPIIMLMSQQSADVVLWALRARIFDVLLKPVSARDVLRCVQRLSPVLEARRTQSTRANATGAEAIPDEARYHARRSSRGKLDGVLGYIEKNYAQPISEQEVARECGMSAFEFSRAFRSAHGITFRDYLGECRLVQIRKRLFRGIAQGPGERCRSDGGVQRSIVLCSIVS
ncbi:response regulator transcription factor [Steroidobacter cummioxidans]|uniref:response regulator transcription factor n=1 Tax=Steroidobacter cummioxidans TaxID=1803913 RepID=UPI000E30CC2B|nr:response regulator transcription factor [Steroidobacter cummioxidans]